jgi:hypothetical protein
MDKIIEEIQNNKTYGISIKYSTPDEYYDDVMKENIKFPEIFPKDGDFFPYTNCWNSELQRHNTCVAYWTGNYILILRIFHFIP